MFLGDLDYRSLGMKDFSYSSMVYFAFCLSVIGTFDERAQDDPFPAL